MKVEFIQRDESESMYGLQWKYTTDDGKHTLSIICNKYSYGWENGQFETQCSWLSDVQGRLTFKQVAQKIDTICKMENSK